MNNTLYPVSLTEGSMSAKQPSEQDIRILNEPGYLPDGGLQYLRHHSG